MKTKLPIYLILISLLLSSCHKDMELKSNSGDQTTVTLTFRGAITGDVTNDPLWLFDQVRAITSIRIYVFNRYPSIGGARFERVVFKTGITAFDSYHYNIEVDIHDNKEFYVIVNEPYGMSAELDRITSISDLKRLNYNFADYFNNNLADAAFCEGGDGTAATATFANLPMFGEVTGIDINLANRDIEINVYRSLARVDFNLKNVSPGEVTLTENSSFSYTTYPSGSFSGLTGTTITTNLGEQVKMYNVGTKIISEDAFERVLSFYTPTRRCDTKEDRIKIYIQNVLYRGVVASYDNPIIIANIKGGGGTVDEIERNTVYTVNATIKSDFQQDWEVDVTINPWEDVILNEDIGNPSIIILEVSQDEESGVANESQIDVICDIGNEDIYIGDDADTGTGSGGYHKLGNATLGTAHFPKWLENAKWVSAPTADGKYTSGRFTFLRQHPGTLEESLKSYSIKVKCAKVTQWIVIRYIQTSGDLEITIADWTDSSDTEGDLNEGKDIVFSSPKTVFIDKKSTTSSYGSLMSNISPFSSEERVDIFLPSNATGNPATTTWLPKVESVSDFQTKLTASYKDFTLKATFNQADDGKSGDFQFYTESTTEFSVPYIIKLKSQNVVRYMYVQRSSSIGEFYPLNSTRDSHLGVIVGTGWYLERDRQSASATWLDATNRCKGRLGVSGHLPSDSEIRAGFSKHVLSSWTGINSWAWSVGTNRVYYVTWNGSQVNVPESDGGSTSKRYFRCVRPIKP